MISQSTGVTISIICSLSALSLIAWLYFVERKIVREAQERWDRIEKKENFQKESIP